MRYDRRGFKPVAIERSGPGRQEPPASARSTDFLVNYRFISRKNAVDLKLYALFLALGRETGGPFARFSALLSTVGQATRLIKQSRVGPIAGRSD